MLCGGSIVGDCNDTPSRNVMLGVLEAAPRRRGVPPARRAQRVPDASKDQKLRSIASPEAPEPSRAAPAPRTRPGGAKPLCESKKSQSAERSGAISAISATMTTGAAADQTYTPKTLENEPPRPAWTAQLRPRGPGMPARRDAGSSKIRLDGVK